MDTNAYKKELGKIVRKLRNKRRWTQEDLAEHFGWTGAYISQIESGDKGVEHTNLVALLETLLDDERQRERLLNYLRLLADSDNHRHLEAIDALISSSLTDK